jgi:carboxymethylenebutenolidase
MNVESQLTVESSDDGTFDCLLVTPTSGTPAPALLLVQEIFGINENMRWTAHRYAKAGFLVLVPDLFWRISPGINLNPADPQQRTKAMELNGQFNAQQGLADCRQAIRAIRTHPASTGRAGAVGYCLGGRLAFLLAAQDSVDAGVCFYPVAVQPELNALRTPRIPLLIHLAADDALCGADAQLEIKTFVESGKTNRVETYPGVGHGFARIGRQGSAADAAERAESITIDFLNEHLA